MQEIVAAFIENVQGLIAQLRDLENQHHERLMEISLLTLEKVIKNEFVDELPEDVRELFVDKDAVMNAVSASHDLHLLRIDNRCVLACARACVRVRIYICICILYIYIY